MKKKKKRIYGKWYNNYGIHLMIGDIEQIPVIAGDVDYIFHTVSISIQDDGAASGSDDTNFIYGNKRMYWFGSR